jgi:NAD(P)-dependent dehydrogenase (short-subunit alcohol dehydrogenase family)/acyl carrier protein
MPSTDVSLPPASVALGETIVSIIAEVTRYPRDILKPDANLEEDLGIDSVKRTEILTVLGSRLGLPENQDGAGFPPRGNGNGDSDAEPVVPRTIGDLVAAVETFVRQEQGQASPAPTAASVPEVKEREPERREKPRATRVEPERSESRPEPGGSLAERVVEIIAGVTHYPRELLQPTADLEDDLGFDQAQRKAIFTALRTRLHLALPENGPLPGVQTIGDIVVEVGRHLPAPAPGARPQPAQPVAQAEQERPAARISHRPFTGKVALVTGAGHGIGKAIAVYLAHLGATVAVNSFHSRQRGEETAAEIVAAGGQSVHLWGSVTNQAQLEGVFREIDSRCGGVDFLIHNASNGILAPLKDMEPTHWDKAFRTNVVALHQASLLAAQSMRRRGGGKIVALSSVGAQRYLEYLGCIGTVKAAVESLVRYLAVELGTDNIQVNAVSAGPVYGELMEKYPDLEQLRPRCEALTPRQRLNDEQEVAEAVAFLLGSSGMSGSVLLLDAGGCQRIQASSGSRNGNG